jgi:hypothetical protein
MSEQLSDFSLLPHSPFPHFRAGYRLRKGHKALQTTTPSIAKRRCFDGKFGVSGELPEQIGGPFELSPAGDRDLLELEHAHAFDDGGQFALDDLEARDRLLDIVGRGRLHSWHPVR